MKKLIMITLCLCTGFAFGKSYNCEFLKDQAKGQIDINVSRQVASLNLQKQNSVNNYQDCKTIKDDFGLLIDCSSRTTDLMVLLTEDNKKIKGGIMSTTHNLYLDIDC